MKIKYTTKPIEMVNGVRIGSRFKSGDIWIRKIDNWYKEKDNSLPNGWTVEQLDEVFLRGDFKGQSKGLE